jgi:hypothetical protein
MGKATIWAGMWAVVGMIAPAVAVPVPRQGASVAENMAFAHQLCADAATKAQVSIDFAEAVRLRFEPLASRMTSDTHVVVAEAHAITAQGYPNGFALENGRVKSVICGGNVAMRINGKIVEYRDLVFGAVLEQAKPPQIMTVDPVTEARFIDHLFIDNEPLKPGNGASSFTSSAQDESMELMAMMDAGIQAPITPEMRTQWRLQRMEQLLGPSLSAGAAR